jgi:hypothetical protein
LGGCFYNNPLALGTDTARKIIAAVKAKSLLAAGNFYLSDAARATLTPL